MNKNTGLAPIFWVIIAAVVLGGGYFVVQKSKSKMENVEPVTEQAVAPTTQKAGQSIVPSDWKTYRNEEYGFEFSYPHDWKVVDDFVVSKASPFERAEVKVLSSSRAAHFRVVSQVDNPYFAEQIKDTEQIFLGDIRAFQTRPFTPANDYGVEEGDFLVTQIYAINEYFYILSYGIAIKGNDKSHEDTLLARRILSTFRFTK